MKTYSLADIQKDARVALDQNVQSTALAELGDTDTLTLDEVIASKAEDAARIIAEAAPLDMFGGGKEAAYAADMEWREDGQGVGMKTLTLPGDFLRLIEFRMSDWRRSVHVPVAIGSPEWLSLHSGYVGTGGNPLRPAVVVKPDNREMEAYRSAESAGVEVFQYVPLPKAADGEMEYHERLYRPMVYMAAALAASAFGANEQASALQASALRLANIETAQTKQA